MAWIRFTADYNHQWPSRAASFFDCNKGVDGKGLYNVKREVADAAIAKGVATMAAKPATPESDEQIPEGLAGIGSVDRSHGALDGDVSLSATMDGQAS